MLRVGHGSSWVGLPEETEGLIFVFFALLIFFLIFWALAKLDVVIPYIRKHKWAGVLPLLVIAGIITGIFLYIQNDTNSNIFLAVQAEHMKAVEKLVSGGTDINTRREDGNNNTPLMEAATWNSKEIVEFLLQKGANPNLIDRYGRTALMLAMLYRENGEEDVLEITKILIAGGTDMTIKNTDGKTAREIATDRGYSRVAEMLK